jgi:hypothetical protein
MPSFGLALAMEGEEEMESHFAKLWINQMEKEVFDDLLFDIHRLYIPQRALLQCCPACNSLR